MEDESGQSLQDALSTSPGSSATKQSDPARKHQGPFPKVPKVEEKPTEEQELMLALGALLKAYGEAAHCKHMLSRLT